VAPLADGRAARLARRRRAARWRLVAVADRSNRALRQSGCGVPRPSDRFLGNLHAGAPAVVSLARIPASVPWWRCCSGPRTRLADILAAHPQVIDALLDPAFSARCPIGAADARLADRSHKPNPMKDFLDRVRLFAEHMFLTRRACCPARCPPGRPARPSGLADVIIRAMHGAVTDQFAQPTAGCAAGERGARARQVGGRETTASSDLDLILVYDSIPRSRNRDGERRLQGSQ